MKQVFNLRKKRTASESISDTFFYLKVHFWNMAKGLLVYVGPFFLIGGVLSGIFNAQFLDFDTTPGYYSPLYFVSLGISALFYGIGGIVMQAYLVEYMRLGLNYTKEELTLQRVGEAIRQRFWSYLGVNFVFMVLFVIAMVIPMMLSVIASFLGPLIVFILMLYVFVAFSLYPFAMGVEQIGFFEAYKRSHVLIRNNWWKSFGYYILIFIIQGVMTGVIMMPIYGVVFYKTFSQAIHTGVAPEPTTMSTLVIVLSQVVYFVMLVFYSFTGVGFGLHYFSLVEHKEEIGLGEQIEAMNKSIDA
jgi:hypothetical protein